MRAKARGRAINAARHYFSSTHAVLSPLHEFPLHSFPLPELVGLKILIRRWQGVSEMLIGRAGTAAV
jgi:hypothetical protein